MRSDDVMALSSSRNGLGFGGGGIERRQHHGLRLDDPGRLAVRLERRGKSVLAAPQRRRQPAGAGKSVAAFVALRPWAVLISAADSFGQFIELTNRPGPARQASSPSPPRAARILLCHDGGAGLLLHGLERLNGGGHDFAHLVPDIAVDRERSASFSTPDIARESGLEQLRLVRNLHRLAIHPEPAGIDRLNDLEAGSEICVAISSSLAPPARGVLDGIIDRLDFLAGLLEFQPLGERSLGPRRASTASPAKPSSP